MDTIFTYKINELHTVLAQKNAEIKQYLATINTMQEEIHLLRAQMYGKSREVTPEIQVPTLFNEMEVLTQQPEPEPTPETIKPRRSPTKREDRFKNLPERDIHYQLAEEDQICKTCNHPLHEIDTEIRTELEYVPAVYTQVNHIMHKYGCRNCQTEGNAAPIVIAPMPKPAFPGSMASASIVAHVAVSKFDYGLPLYRQERAIDSAGIIHLSRQTLANWMLQGSNQLYVIYLFMRTMLLNRDIIHADETTVQVLKENGRHASTKSYMWLYRTGRDGPPIVLFEYKCTRSGQNPITFLKDFSGFLQTDGYVGYDNLNDSIVRVACWAHARRKFTDALKVVPAGASAKATASNTGLKFCNLLFDKEREFKDLTPEERHEKRNTVCKPILDAFKKWLDEQSVIMLPKSKLGAAVGYCINQWPKLLGYLQDGRLEIDNNRAERSIKNFVIGRKNWLFANTPDGAEASAIYYSIIETAKENGLNPYDYLKNVFDMLPNIKTSDPNSIAELMPWSETMQRLCRIAIPKQD